MNPKTPRERAEELVDTFTYYSLNFIDDREFLMERIALSIRQAELAELEAARVLVATSATIKDATRYLDALIASKERAARHPRRRKPSKVKP